MANLIRQYFVQLTEGCKQDGCENPHCATGSGKPMDHNQAAAAALQFSLGRTKKHLCVSKDVVDRSPSMNSILQKGYSSSSSGITSSSRNDPQQTPEPMDTSESSDGTVSITESTVPSTSSGTSLTDTSSSVEQLPNAASSTLILVTSSASTGDTPPSSPPSHTQPTSSSEGIQTSSSSEVSSSYGVQVTSSSSSGMDLTTSDSVSVSSAELDLTTITSPRIKFSGSTLFNKLTSDGTCNYHTSGISTNFIGSWEGDLKNKFQLQLNLESLGESPGL